MCLHGPRVRAWCWCCWGSTPYCNTCQVMHLTQPPPCCRTCRISGSPTVSWSPHREFHVSLLGAPHLIRKLDLQLPLRNGWTPVQSQSSSHMQLPSCQSRASSRTSPASGSASCRWQPTRLTPHSSPLARLSHAMLRECASRAGVVDRVHSHADPVQRVGAHASGPQAGGTAAEAACSHLHAGAGGGYAPLLRSPTPPRLCPCPFCSCLQPAVPCRCLLGRCSLYTWLAAWLQVAENGEVTAAADLLSARLAGPFPPGPCLWQQQQQQQLW